MKLPEMVQRVAEADEAGAYCFQVGGLQRERFEEMVDLFGPFGRRVVRNGFAGEPPTDNGNPAVCDLQDRPPDGLESDFPSRFGEGRIETANGRLAACSRDPNDEPRELIEPRIEHNDAGELEQAARSEEHTSELQSLRHLVC